MSSNIRELLQKSGRPKSSGFFNGYPTQRQMFARHPPTLTENKIDDTYNSVSEYLEIHCDLLLEDFMYPLRESLKGFKRNPRADFYDGARVFRKVKLTNFDRRNSGKFMLHTCYLDQETLNLKGVNGAKSEPPSFGYLLLFTRSDFSEDLFLGKVVSDRERTGGIKIQLRLFKDQAITLEEIKKGCFTMMQADSFFYMYDKVLEALHELDEQSFPMREYIVYGHKCQQVKHPRYLSDRTVYKIGNYKVLALDHTDWPSHEEVNLDESQFATLKRALSEEIVVVQGPPGTGKTYFGVRLVNVLLDNIHIWNPCSVCPLLVVCQSNQALDNFLEELLSTASTDKIVRIGDQCQSELLQPYFLKELVCRKVAENKNSSSSFYLKPTLQKIDEIRLILKGIVNGIIDFKTFEKWGIIDDNLFDSGQSYLNWMGFDIEVDERRARQNGNGFIITLKELRERVEKLVVIDKEMAIRAQNDIGGIGRLLLRVINEIQSDYDARDDRDILSLSPSDARTKYLCWVDALNVALREELKHLVEELYRLEEEISYKTRETAKTEVVRSAFVVGLTSTAASARRPLLEAMQSPIVIIEEAAEVLESHVVVSMTKSCEHLILLGDHKQLKPGTSTHHLAVDYYLNMSLFERLLRNNIVEGMCLTTQYRMRPEISALLRPHFYQKLDDAEETKHREHIQGLQKDLFFLDHRELEHYSEEEKGFYNPHEVDMLINLAKYLILYGGYSALDITIISMYGEQRSRLIKKRDEDPSLANMDIASVDSFQGKENEIILVSLVRSNPEGKIGFLKEDNRVCVALSRAKKGLYIMGNMRCLTKDCFIAKEKVDKSVWIHAKQRLQEQDALGSELVLVCPKHGCLYRVSRNAHWYRPFCEKCSFEEQESERTQRLARERVNGVAYDQLERYFDYGEPSNQSQDFSEEKNGDRGYYDEHVGEEHGYIGKRCYNGENHFGNESVTGEEAFRWNAAVAEEQDSSEEVDEEEGEIDDDEEEGEEEECESDAEAGVSSLKRVDSEERIDTEEGSDTENGSDTVGKSDDERECGTKAAYDGDSLPRVVDSLTCELSNLELIRPEVSTEIFDLHSVQNSEPLEVFNGFLKTSSSVSDSPDSYFENSLSFPGSFSSLSETAVISSQGSDMRFCSFNTSRDVLSKECVENGPKVDSNAGGRSPPDGCDMFNVEPSGLRVSNSPNHKLKAYSNANGYSQYERDTSSRRASNSKNTNDCVLH